MKVTVGQRTVDLQKGDVISNLGGEALIFALGSDIALKIYHAPSSARARKLEDFWKLGLTLPANVCAPLEPAKDQDGKIIGFSMRRLPDGFDPIVLLGSRDFCTQHGLTAKDIVTLFVQLCTDLIGIHKAGLVVGDLSDKNEVVDPRNRVLAWLDVDSWQFGRHPCMVGTEKYLSPDLYGVDLSKKPLFETKHDWYSVAVLLFIALVRAHPFKGFHPVYKSLTACSQQGLTILDQGVRYPNAALPPDVLSDELKDLLLAYLKRQRGDQFPIQQLAEYGEILTPCPNCGLWYPGTRSNCPGCAEKTTLDVQLAAKLAGFECENLVRVKGQILHVAMIGSNILCLATEFGQTILYKKEKGRQPIRTELWRSTPGASFQLFSDLLVVCADPSATTPELFVVSVSGPAPQPILQTTTDQLRGSKAVFGTSERYLYRIAGPRILQGELFAGRVLKEREVTSALPGQTWFAVSPNPDPNHECLCGFMRVMGDLRWFLVVGEEAAKRFSRFEISLPSLNSGESLTDLSVRFSRSSVLVIRKTREKGIDYVRIAIIRMDGTVESAYRVAADQMEPYDTIHGKAYHEGMIIHAGDKGLVREATSTGAQTPMAGTERYATSGDQLIPYGDGVLIIGKDSIRHLYRK